MTGKCVHEYKVVWLILLHECFSRKMSNQPLCPVLLFPDWLRILHVIYRYNLIQINVCNIWLTVSWISTVISELSIICAISLWKEIEVCWFVRIWIWVQPEMKHSKSLTILWWWIQFLSGFILVNGCGWTNHLVFEKPYTLLHTTRLGAFSS